MILSHRQQHLLREIDAELTASDPRLASMMGIFTRLTEAEPLPRRWPRRWPRRHGWPRQPHRHRWPRWPVARIRLAMAVALTAAMLSYGILASGGRDRGRGAVLPATVTCTAGRPGRRVRQPSVFPFSAARSACASYSDRKSRSRSP